MFQIHKEALFKKSKKIFFDPKKKDFFEFWKRQIPGFGQYEFKLAGFLISKVRKKISRRRMNNLKVCKRSR